MHFFDSSETLFIKFDDVSEDNDFANSSNQALREKWFMNSWLPFY